MLDSGSGGGSPIASDGEDCCRESGLCLVGVRLSMAAKAMHLVGWVNEADGEVNQHVGGCDHDVVIPPCPLWMRLKDPSSPNVDLEFSGTTFPKISRVKS